MAMGGEVTERDNIIKRSSKETKMEKQQNVNGRVARSSYN
jgi:hypothetical protein